MPTLTVLGDGLDLILSTLDIGRPITGSKVQEEGDTPGSRKVLLHRPWNDILTENREKWQKKHDAGKSFFLSFDTLQLLYFKYTLGEPNPDFFKMTIF